MGKDEFIDGHKQLDIIEDSKNFLKKIEEFKLYIVEFEANGAIKAIIYPFDCAVGKLNWHPIIVITHDECTFSANNDIQKVWI